MFGIKLMCTSGKMLLGEWHGTRLMISQLGSGTVREQAITWANVDSDLCRHMASLA